MTESELKALSSEAWAKGGNVMQLMASSELNAYDTVYVEKAAPESELTALTLASLQTALSFCNDSEAVAWYVAKGIEF